MQIHRDIDNLPAFRNAIVTIGTFDGVHSGHRQIIDKLKSEAAKVGGETVIITFHPHPRKVVSSTILGIRLINTLEEKLSLLEELGIDHTVVVPFTDAFANQPAEDYIRNFLVARFNPHTIIIGYDHRFGRDRLGDYRLLEEKAPELGFELKEIPKHLLENISISSTHIREAILHSEIDKANRLLGYDFFFSGLVVDGDKLGRKLGYPTANLRVTDEEKIVPGNGIYAVYADVLDESNNSPELSAFTKAPLRLRGMMSIGFRPTVDGKKRVIEVNLFDFGEDIYGRRLRVFVKHYLRPEARFESLDALVEQIGRDKVESLKVL
jgi:riboflavin kinase / FMN adenylyltransferase